MVGHVVLAGLPRGNSVCWNSLLESFSSRFTELTVYIGSQTPWDGFDIPHVFISLKEIPDELTQVWGKIEHHLASGYSKQWAKLLMTYCQVKDNVSDGDVVIKARNDIIIHEKLPFFEFKENTIYVPAIEFHADHPFNTRTLCNDQILIGKKAVMDRYFNLPLRYEWFTHNRFSSDAYYKNDARNDIRPAIYCIEEILREYLYQQKIELDTFPFNYSKA